MSPPLGDEAFGTKDCKCIPLSHWSRFFCFLSPRFVAFVLQAMLAAATFLQGFVNFCAGCFIFGYLVQFGLVSKAVFRMHVNTRWEKCRGRVSLRLSGSIQSRDGCTAPLLGALVDGVWMR